MKKTAVALLLVVLTLSACGKASPVTDTTIPVETETATEALTTEKDSDKITINPDNIPEKQPSPFKEFTFSEPDNSPESTTAKFFETTGSDISSGLTEGDIALLEEFYPSMGMTGFDAYSKTAVSDAYSIILGMFGIYSNYFSYVEITHAADPLNQYPYDSYATGHYAYPEENVDWILNNVFNVKPDHEVYSTYDDGTVWLYYHDGFYYTEAFIYGLDYSMIWKLNSYTNISQNKYELKMDVYHSNPDGDTLYGQMDVTARLKTVDGNKVWSFTKIKLVSGKGTEY
ncbi:MAG: hypothetical protein IJB86_07120 [Clostridia bacterium]|nr:hypothetical protein [Clostridia bacterium]